MLKWISIEDESAPDNKLVYLFGNKEGKEIVGPVIGYYDLETDFYYDEYGLGHSWFTHWMKIPIPRPPDIEK